MKNNIIIDKVKKINYLFIKLNLLKELFKKKLF